MENYYPDTLIKRILLQYQTLLENNHHLLVDTGLVEAFFSTDNLLHRDYHFITYSLIYHCALDNVSLETAKVFFGKFSPEMVLAIVTLYYIHKTICEQ